MCVNTATCIDLVLVRINIPSYVLVFRIQLYLCVYIHISCNTYPYHVNVKFNQYTENFFSILNLHRHNHFSILITVFYFSLGKNKPKSSSSRKRKHQIGGDGLNIKRQGEESNVANW